MMAIIFSIQCAKTISWKYLNMFFNLKVSTVPADGLAPFGARSSADTVMTKFVLYILRVLNDGKVDVCIPGHPNLGNHLD